MKKITSIVRITWSYILFAALLLSPTIFVKAESNAEPPKTIESFKVDDTKEECSFTYNLEEATEWMSNIIGIKKNEQTIPMPKCIINAEGGTITIKTALSENDKISISSEGYQDVTFIVQGEHLFNTAWKHDENTHWKECMVKDCAERTEEVKHTGGQATCQKKAECEVCGQEYGELGAHNYGSEWKHDETSHWRECQTKGCTDKTDVAKHSGGQATYQKKAICSVCKVSYGEVKKEGKAAKVATQIKKLDVKVSNLTMKKISEVQAARKAYNTLSKKEKDTIRKDVSTLTKAETLIKQNNCGTNVYYRFSNNTLTIFGKGAMKNCFVKTTANMDIKRKVKNRIYKKYIPNVVNIVVEKGVTKIGNGAFACMPKLKTAQVQGNLGMAAFWGCANLEKVTYTNGAGTIGFACFAECKKLKSVAIPEGISAIDKSCFANCKKLKQINLPSTLKTIGENGFYGCTGLRTVTVKGRVTKCKIFAFYKVTKCKVILKTKAAKKSKKVFAKELKQEGNKKVKIK